MRETISPLEKQTLLIVDDAPENIAVLSSLLRGQYVMKVATNGVDALEIASSARERPDLILLDITMPGMNGYDVCRHLKADEELRDIPVIFLSALNETVDKVKAFSAGGIDYVTKPFHSEEVKARVETHLKLRRLQVALESQNLKLQESNEQLRELHALKDRFLEIASHDLKNPLTCIMCFVSMIASSIPPGATMTENHHSFLDKVMSQCRAMNKIIEDFLSCQSTEYGKLKLNKVQTDLNAIADSVIDHNAQYAEQKNVTLLKDLDSTLPMVNADGGRLNQVFENFIGNAIKFSRPEGVVTVVTRITDDGFLIEVCDSGPGLTEADMENLFVKHAKLSNKPTGGESSSGLGLSICKEVIDMHGGQTGARNNKNRGSTFWFMLPLGEQYTSLSVL